jgi:hypothetical protein
MCFACGQLVSEFVHVWLSASAPHEHVPSTLSLQHVNNTNHGLGTWEQCRSTSKPCSFICEKDPPLVHIVLIKKLLIKLKKSLQ